jgi:hypothetical protein
MVIFSRNPSDTLRYNYLDNDDTALESLIAKHRKYGTSLLQHTESDHELKSTSKERQTRGRNDERYEQNGRKRRSQSLVGFRFSNFDTFFFNQSINSRVHVVVHPLVFVMNIHRKILIIIIIIHFWLDHHQHQVFKIDL